jgi:ornithine carbamoyltransferase
MTDHLLEVADLTAADLHWILDRAEAAPNGHRPLAGCGVALYFEKPSARTRNSMEMAVVQLGGHPIYLQPAELGIGTRETAEDVTRTLACYHRVVGARVCDHLLLERMRSVAAVPILNLLSDRHHPLQALADLLTIRQRLGRLAGVRVAFVGEANNVARSLAQGCSLVGADFAIASPPGFGFSEELPNVRQLVAPEEAVAGADVVCSDTWVSMGQSDSAERRRSFAPYQVNFRLMKQAPGAIFLHCLPAHRGEEVTAEVIDGPRSAVWKQAENRLHTARAALEWLLSSRGAQ